MSNHSRSSISLGAGYLAVTVETHFLCCSDFLRSSFVSNFGGTYLLFNGLQFFFARNLKEKQVKLLPTQQYDFSVSNLIFPYEEMLVWRLLFPSTMVLWICLCNKYLNRKLQEGHESTLILGLQGQNVEKKISKNS